MSDAPAPAPNADGFDAVLDAFLALPRVGGLALSPDGDRLVVGVAELVDDGTRFGTALWELDPAGARAPRRLTRSEKGEGAPLFTPESDLLFVSARPAPGGEEGKDVPRLWRLPASGGEAEVVAAPPAGVLGATVARDAGTVLVRAAVHPSAKDWEADAEHEKARSEAKVTAQLVEHYPARYWDRWLGPRQPRLHAAASATADAAWETLTPQPGHLLEEQGADISADGRVVVLTRAVDAADPRDRTEEVVVLRLGDDASVVDERVLVREDRVSYWGPAISPDGSRVALVRRPLGGLDEVPDSTLVLLDLDGDGAAVDVLEGFDRWPNGAVWTPDGGALLFTADDDGRTLPFRVDLASGSVTRLASEGAWSELVVAPDGGVLYAVRADVGEAPHVVALDLDGVSEPRVVHAPAADGIALGRVERVEATASDGARVPGWLVLPEGASADSPAPLVLFIHGGPLGSWAGWHWRWNPHVLASQGWAVLCPDPALSTGYGLDFVRRGWGRWGAEPYTDILALTDEVVARPEVDGSRTAAMGGSFGGYMANWIAGHTDRFRAIVTHASLWNLEAFHGTTDLGPWWENEFGDRYTEPERYREWSPHRFVGDITTPMLVIHGERDFRVPVSEGLSLWTDLRRHGVPGAYLHFPDENHWILRPPNVRAWYATVERFLAHHVLGEPWERPSLV